MVNEFCCSKSEGQTLIKLYNLHESSLGYSHGAIKQYRDSKPADSLHAREFLTKFCIHSDKYNPEINPIEHFLVDVVKPEAVLAGGLATVIALAFTKNPKSAIGWGLGIGTLVQILVDNNNVRVENG